MAPLYNKKKKKKTWHKWGILLSNEKYPGSDGKQTRLTSNIVSWAEVVGVHEACTTIHIHNIITNQPRAACVEYFQHWVD